MTEPARNVITRRHFLAGAAAASLTAVVAGHRDQIGALLDSLGEPSNTIIGAIETSVPTPSFTFSVERETDLALLDFEFYGFKKVIDIVIAGATEGIGRVAGKSVTKLEPTSSANAIVVQFPPQAIAEAAYNYESTQATWAVDPPPVLSALSGPSRLCFTLPTTGSVAFSTMTAADLLDWSGWTLLAAQPAKLGQGATAPVAALPSGTIPTPSDPTESGMVTYIEYPYGLYLTPTVSTISLIQNAEFSTTFTGRPDPLTSSANFVDLFTAALVQTELGGKAIASEGAAIWSRDYRAPDDHDATPETYIYYGAT